jgi:putative RNA 2'-phosphotransferase
MKDIQRILAKTISYIGYHSPGEYGLFWDDDGTMPWKEFHWALQREPDLGFVRASTLHELQQLGFSLPFVLDGRLLRLRDGVTHTPYPLVITPSRLYYSCLRKNLQHAREFGLVSHQRRYVALASQPALAVSIARRRDPQPILIEIQAAKAQHDGIAFRLAGEYLYLVEALPPQYLVFPLISTKTRGQVSKGNQKDRRSQVPTAAAYGGSFQLGIEHLRGNNAAEDPLTTKGSGKPSKSRDWKRDARRLRDKRKV